MATVVRLQMATALAAREAARLGVSRFEKPAQRRRHRSPLAPGAHRESVPLDLRDDVGIAAEATCRLGGDDGSVVELGAAPGIGREGNSIDMDDEPRTPPLLVVGRAERGVGKLEQRLDPHRARLPRRKRQRVRGHVANLGRRGTLLTPPLEHAVVRGVERLHEERSVLGREAGAQVQRAVLLEVVTDELELVRLASVRSGDPPVHPQGTLEL